MLVRYPDPNQKQRVSSVPVLMAPPLLFSLGTANTVLVLTFCMTSETDKYSLEGLLQLHITIISTTESALPSAEL